MPATLHFTFPYPLPAELSPDLVLAALQTYEPLITPNPYMKSYRRRPVDLSEIIDDPFFREDGRKLAAFEVIDRIVLIPGVASKEVIIPCVMQAFDGGVRCRSYAQGGVKVWSTWTLRPAARDKEAALAADAADEAAAWEIVEDARVECSPLVKPFVGKSFASAHKEILRRVVDEIIRQSARGSYGSRYA